MKVKNRAGQSLDVHYDEIKRRILRLCTEHEASSVDIDQVVIQTIHGIYDGISTSELDDLSARVCASLQSLHYAYDAIAAKILVSNMAKNVRGVLSSAGLPLAFSAKVRYLNSRLPQVYDPAFMTYVLENASWLDSAICYERDGSHSYFALRTLERSYLMRAGDQCVEAPQDMWMRVAVAIHMPRGDEDMDGAKRRILGCYEAMSRGDYTHATPTLFNAGMRVQQCSSCYLIGTEDSLSGIFNTLSECAQISKWAGGIGVHVSNVRASGAVIHSTNGSSDGIIPMLKVFNECARYCNQSGRRKGSIAVYLEPWHADVWEFVELRRNTGAETERARDLFLALWTPDEFMRRVQADEDWYLMTPDVSVGLIDACGAEFTRLYNEHVAEGRYVRKVRARTLWQHILTCQLETGTPYMLFKDHVNLKSNQSNVGTIRSSNLCAEVTEYSDSQTHAVCNLASIAVNRFVTADGMSVDHGRLHEVAKQVARNLDRIIDINAYPTDGARRSNTSLRPIGIGMQGLGDLYCMLGLPYDDPRAIKLDADVMETIYHGALEASAEMAEELGAYERFEGSPASRGVLQPDMWMEAGASSFASSRYDWQELRERVRATGMRNSLLTALMPTASTSQILGNCECFEPFQSNLFKRSTLAGEFVVVNNHLMRDLMRAGLWDKQMRTQLLANDGSVQRIERVPADLKRIYRTVWEVPQRAVIDHARARGPFVCQSQSMNLYMQSPTVQKLSDALMYAWSRGLKTGMYYLRSTAAVEAIKYGVSASGGVASKKAVVEKSCNAVDENGACMMCSA